MLLFVFIFISEMEFRSCYPGWMEYNSTISAHRNLRLLGSDNSPASASWVAGIKGTRHHAQLILYFLVETGFHHVDQDGLDLLTSWSTRLGHPKCWDNRREPPRPAWCYYYNNINLKCKWAKFRNQKTQTGKLDKKPKPISHARIHKGSK